MMGTAAYPFLGSSATSSAHWASMTQERLNADSNQREPTIPAL
jgi:hypothetical protein